MSDYPCSNCRATNRGRLKYVYVTYFKGEDVIKTRGRLCAECFDGLLADYLAVAEIPDARGRWLTKEEQ